MIYPDISLEAWLEKHPGLVEMVGYDRECFCGREPQNFRPYLSKNYAGIIADPCECGRGGMQVAVPNNPETIAFWQGALGVLTGHSPGGQP